MVAWKGEDFESSFLIVTVEALKLSVMGLGLTSAMCYIDDEEQLFLVFTHRAHGPVYIHGGYFVERGRYVGVFLRGTSHTPSIKWILAVLSSLKWRRSKLKSVLSVQLAIGLPRSAIDPCYQIISFHHFRLRLFSIPKNQNTNFELLIY